MNEDPQSPTPIDDPVRSMVRDAGRRPAMPEATFHTIRDAAHNAWQDRLLRQRRKRYQRWLAVAATLTMAAIGLTTIFQSRFASTLGEQAPIATVEVALEVRAGSGTRLAAGDACPVGSAVSTGAQGRLALRLADGASLRLAEHSELILDRTNAVNLVRGMLYVDSESDPQQTRPGLVVTTPLGTVREIGTQFTVKIDDETVAVAVREGKIELRAGDRHHRATAGERLTLSANGTLDRQAVTGYGESWAWVSATAPPFDLEGRMLDEFLRWVAREAGWRIRYDPTSLATEAAEIAIHGSIAGVSPDRAIHLVLPTAGFDSQLDGGTLVVMKTVP